MHVCFSPRLHRLLCTTCLCATLLPLSGCLVARVQGLEQEVERLTASNLALKQALDEQSLRSDSVAVGLEKLTERVDAMTPASAQWLLYRPGAAIKWYVDEQIQNIYLQFVDQGSDRSGVVVAVTSRVGSTQQTLRPGDAVEMRWTGSRPERVFSITCHRVQFNTDKTLSGLFSIQEVRGTGG
jgi:hypothetical protein